jgi:lysine 6-dehydrogenase
MKKILVLGGVGAMANETTRDLVKTSKFEEIMVADVNLKKAEAFIKELNDTRLKACFIDANDLSALVKLMKEYDIIANGLPRTFLEKATHAAIEAKVNIIDLVSPSAETLAMDEKAKNAGISAVGGVGITPGITNLLAKHGSDKFEQVEQIDIDFAAFRSIAHSPGLLHVILWEFDPRTETRYSFENNQLTPHPPFSGARVVHFPEPIGVQTTYYVPHGESRTLSKNIKGVKKVFIRGTFAPDSMRLVKSLYDFGFFESSPIIYQNESIQPLEFVKAYLLSARQGDQTPLWGYSVQAEVIGFVNGKKMLYQAQTTHPPMEKWGGARTYDKNVGIPLSVGAQLIADGKTLKKGVDGAENMLPPQPFIDELRKREFIILEKFKELA